MTRRIRPFSIALQIWTDFLSAIAFFGGQVPLFLVATAHLDGNLAGLEKPDALGFTSKFEILGHVDRTIRGFYVWAALWWFGGITVALLLGAVGQAIHHMREASRQREEIQQVLVRSQSILELLASDHVTQR